MLDRMDLGVLFAVGAGTALEYVLPSPGPEWLVLRMLLAAALLALMNLAAHGLTRD